MKIKVGSCQGSTMQPLKTFKTAWTYLTSQETAIRFMNVIGPLQKKKIRIFCFRKNVVIG